MKNSVLILALAAAGLSVPGYAGGPDEDLAIVKKAVSKETVSKDQAVSKEESAKGAPQWFHIRVEGKGTKKERVSINLPFALVEALGDAPIHCKKLQDASGKPIRIADILKTLKAGQQLVEIEDEESTVRIWLD